MRLHETSFAWRLMNPPYAAQKCSQFCISKALMSPISKVCNDESIPIKLTILKPSPARALNVLSVVGSILHCCLRPSGDATIISATRSGVRRMILFPCICIPKLKLSSVSPQNDRYHCAVFRRRCSTSVTEGVRGFVGQ